MAELLDLDLNETSGKYEELSQKLGNLEREYYSDKKLIKGAAAVALVLIGAFFGITLSQIGSKVDDAIAAAAEYDVKAALERIEEAEARVVSLRGTRGLTQETAAGSGEQTATCQGDKRIVFGFTLHWTDGHVPSSGV